MRFVNQIKNIYYSGTVLCCYVSIYYNVLHIVLSSLHVCVCVYKKGEPDIIFCRATVMKVI